MMKRLLSLVLVLVLVFALVGCGSKKREIVEITLSTEDAEAILAAAGITLPDATEVAVSGTNVKWFSWFDPFHNYDDAEVVNTGFWTFKNKYGCDVEWIECTWDQRYDGLANLILAGTSPDFAHGEANTFPYNALKGIFQPVDDYIDYNDPLWAGVKDYADQRFSLAGKHYLMIYDIGFNNVVAYNKRVMEEWGFDDPAQLFYNDEWTWDVFYDMCVEFSEPDEERYALDGWGFCNGLMNSCGETLVEYDLETQQFVSNLDDPRLEKAANLLYDLNKNQCVWPRWNNGWAVRGNTEGTGMKEGLCLFWIRGTWVFTGTVEEISNLWGDMTQNELMFVPLPRDPDGDGRYVTESIPNAYGLVKGAENPEAVALLASCDRFKVLDPTVVSIDRRQLEEIYLWTDEMLAMYDTCVEIANSGSDVIVAYDAGLGTKLSSIVGEIEGTAFQSEAQSWAQLKEKYGEQMDYYVADLNSQMAEFENE